jgi:hypothetical protein
MFHFIQHDKVIRVYHRNPSSYIVMLTAGKHLGERQRSPRTRRPGDEMLLFRFAQGLRLRST